MKISRLRIKHFRGISSAELHFPDHAVLIGDNNTGKSTILEAINLAMGPDRLNRKPPIDEHDFYQGRYLLEPAPNAEADEGGTRRLTQMPTSMPTRLNRPPFGLKLLLHSSMKNKSPAFRNISNRGTRTSKPLSGSTRLTLSMKRPPNLRRDIELPWWPFRKTISAA